MNSLTDENQNTAMDDTVECEHSETTVTVTLPTIETLDAAAAMLSAAGDPARLRLLLRLAEGRQCVSELAALEGDKLATVSARLKLLHAARLVTRSREAKHVFYELADKHVACLVRDTLDHAAEETLSAREGANA